ncbi:MAG TPA: cofactor-independent phosphoglycerate mutase [Syntrophus sp. (in: bacteria)]|nr:MAG: cofactor-independent phosphoglycerate mutase [Syntrophus sp. GWC2_56_31]HBB18785.1 cofactor-independent phosphoglycerate mutase [Syntrophus sp. (in: bacteria)]
MKHLILLGDGMSDYPIDVLGGKTALEYASTPHMDRMAAEGTLGLIDTIPPGLPPGSDVANLSVLGYNPKDCYTGRGPLEAANMGVALSPEDIAFRCNLVTLRDGIDPVMEDFTAGHISSLEAKAIIADLEIAIGSETFSFHPGVGYRHLLVWKGGESELVATPPHDITDKAIGAYLPRGRGAEAINRLMRLSREFLADHPVNRERTERGLRPATSIWLWGQGRAPRIRKMMERFRIRGGIISAVDLLNGIGVYAGLEVLPVEGATGYIDTNYRGKAEKALAVLKELDLVFIHVEAPDEMGHEGNVEGKVKAIEDFDAQVVGTVLQGIGNLGPFRIAVLSDHPTPLSLKTHVADPSPFAVLSSLPGENQGRGTNFGEETAALSGNLISPGYRFMETFIRNWRTFVGSDTRYKEKRQAYGKKD